MGLGMLMATQAYNVYVMSTLSFVMQLENPTEEALKKEEEALGMMFKGPYRWAKPSDFWYLKEHFWQKMSCRSLKHASEAAQLRIGYWEKSLKRQAKLKAASLRQEMSSTVHFDRLHRWKDWYKGAYIFNIASTEQSQRQ